ncbi:MAG: alpha/beta hydrolase [Bacteroidota bacterium]|nr:alpha/beta hydrolase [Bacteroidota bacterium]
MRTLFLSSLLFLSLFLKAQQDEIFPTPDGVLIHAKFYYSDAAETKMMVLCHQARYSKGEYQETAPKFNKLGYTCLAIDQRSGDKVNDDVNKTAEFAKKMGLPTEFEDAETDIRQAVNYLFSKYGKKITLVGSSYSAGLVLKVAAAEKDKVEGVISFSPGEYFHDTTIVRESLKKLDIPVWITCSKEEIVETEKLFKGLEKKNITFFKPKEEGKHGSKALWKNNPDNKEYWESLLLFLKPKK